MLLNPIKLTSEVFQEGMAKLATIFQDKKITEDFVKVYYERLNFCTDKEFSLAVNDILDKEQWFPTISVFLKWLPSPKVYKIPVEELIS